MIQRNPHPVFWVIAVALLAIAAELILAPKGAPPGLELLSAASAQPVSSGGSRGIFAFTGQLTASTYGLYLVDVDTMTIWTYEYVQNRSCLRLASARTWRYDRYLENYNTCNLPPEDVEKMIEDQRAYRLKSTENRMP